MCTWHNVLWYITPYLDPSEHMYILMKYQPLCEWVGGRACVCVWVGVSCAQTLSHVESQVIHVFNFSFPVYVCDL